jgi:hypothetical protein
MSPRRVSPGVCEGTLGLVVLVKQVTPQSRPFSHRGICISTPWTRERFMSVLSLSQDLQGFAIELRKLAYTMPGGMEDPLIRLSERMVRHAQQQTAENQSRSI